MNPEQQKRIRGFGQQSAAAAKPAEAQAKTNDNGGLGALMLTIEGVAQLIDQVAQAAHVMTEHHAALVKQNELLAQQNHLLDLANRIAAAPVLPQRDAGGSIVSATKDLSGITGVSDDEEE